MFRHVVIQTETDAERPQRQRHPPQLAHKAGRRRLPAQQFAVSVPRIRAGDNYAGQVPGAVGELYAAGAPALRQDAFYRRAQQQRAARPAEGVGERVGEPLRTAYRVITPFRVLHRQEDVLHNARDALRRQAEVDPGSVHHGAQPGIAHPALQHGVRGERHHQRQAGGESVGEGKEFAAVHRVGHQAVHHRVAAVKQALGYQRILLEIVQPGHHPVYVRPVLREILQELVAEGVAAGAYAVAAVRHLHRQERVHAAEFHLALYAVLPEHAPAHAVVGYPGKLVHGQVERVIAGLIGGAVAAGHGVLLGYQHPAAAARQGDTGRQAAGAGADDHRVQFCSLLCHSMLPAGPTSPRTEPKARIYRVPR